MAEVMIYAIAGNIISPLGIGVEKNLDSVLSNRCEMRRYYDGFSHSEPCYVSLLKEEDLSSLAISDLMKKGGYTFFEALCIMCVHGALKDAGLPITLASDKDTLFVLSTTKGNVGNLANDMLDERCYIGGSAEKIASYFANVNTPIVASNACISGVCAQICAVRELQAGRYRNVIVIGCDVLSEFIVSGFQSFKALSQKNCKPFDKDRGGLNLGSAASCMVLTRSEVPMPGKWEYKGSSIHNDANHISGPSRTGEGSYRVLRDILEDVKVEDLAVVNCHGTATLYNDEMESIALHRADLDSVPVNGLKGYYGHTLGAAGVMETVLTMAALEKGILLATRGYETCGTSYPLNISSATRNTDKHLFIKLLSGFGGTNAGIAYQMTGK